MAGKGSRYRPVDRDTFNANWDRIFAKDAQPDLRAARSVSSQEELRETFVGQSVKTADRCPKTVDIEDVIREVSDRDLGV